ncbi:hypothetical protein DFH09DRAFT_1197621 [Mycena vulgaris]|nr:hypothetical protein DFH09DRAFT_1197621 [Mycena vulgaris]
MPGLKNRPLQTMAILFRRLSFRKVRTSTDEDDDRTDKSERSSTEGAFPSSETPQTARNALILALTTLSYVSSNIPFASILSSVIDPLLDITNRIDQVSTNERGLLELTARIKLLTPIVSEITGDTPEGSTGIVKALKQELELITKDLTEANSQGKLARFFNSTDNASSIASHNTKLAQIIADSTFVGVQEVLKSLRKVEQSQLVEMGDIAGGFGGMGGSGYIGGDGGEGEGPNLLDFHAADRMKFGDISGGTGGTGGAGVWVGGKGGTGKAPVFSTRRYPAPIARREREQE